MNKANYNPENLPEYAVGLNSSEDNEFLIRLHAPRFVGMIEPQADDSVSIDKIEWIDPVDAAEAERVMREACAWLDEENAFLAEEEEA